MKLLAAGRPLPFVAAATGLSGDAVSEIGGEHGWPDRDRLRDAARVLTVQCADRIPERAHTPPPSRPVSTPAAPQPALPVPGGTLNGTGAGNGLFTVGELVRACRRSEHKRTQALGPKLTDLAEKIAAALRAEREGAEIKAQQSAKRVAAQAEVKRLTKALAEAKARAVAAGAPGGSRGGPRPCPECGTQLASAQALGLHNRHQHGKTRASEADNHPVEEPTA